MLAARLEGLACARAVTAETAAETAAAQLRHRDAARTLAAAWEPKRPPMLVLDPAAQPAQT